jgi:hypothetical protein
MSEDIKINLEGLKFLARLVDAVVQLRQYIHTHTPGGWAGYDYADKVDQLLSEADAFGEASDG